MLHLDFPNYTVETSLQVCINGTRNNGDDNLADRLTAATPQIIDADNHYHAMATNHETHTIDPDINPQNLSVEEMGNLYVNQFRDGPGRYIYDNIKISSPHELCPYCTVNHVTEIDHYMPKSRFSTLAISPKNLVPSCTECNKAKSFTVYNVPEDEILHPYYDDLSDHVWLCADVIQEWPGNLTFRVVAPGAWDDILTERVQKHFRKFKMANLFRLKAAHELSTSRQRFIDKLTNESSEHVREELARRASDAEVYSINDWKTVAYRAWSENEWFYNGGFLMPE